MPLTPRVPEDPALVDGGGDWGGPPLKEPCYGADCARISAGRRVCCNALLLTRTNHQGADKLCAPLCSFAHKSTYYPTSHTHTRRIARTQLYAPPSTVAELVRPTVHCEAAASAAAAQEFKSSQRQRRGRLAFVAYVRPYERPCVSVRAHQRASIGDRLQPSPRCPLMLGRARISRRQIYSH